MTKSMLERIESVIKDNIEAALPKGVSVDYHYAAVSVLLVLETPTEAMIKAGDSVEGGPGFCDEPGDPPEPYSIYQAMIKAARS